MAAAAPTTPREVFPEVDVPARLIINKIDVRAEVPHFFTVASAAGSSTAAPYSDDYYRRERLPASEGGHAMSGGHAPSGGGGTDWTGALFAVIGVLFFLWLLSYTPLWTGNWNNSARPAAFNGLTATPSGQPYRGPVSGPNGIKYTNNACVRNDGSQGREGYRGGELGCWRF